MQLKRESTLISQSINQSINQSTNGDEFVERLPEEVEKGTLQ